MKRALVLLGIFALAGCQQQRSAVGEAASTVLTAVAPQESLLCENKPYSQEDLEQAALDILWPKLIFEQNIKTPERLVEARVRLAKVKAWVVTIDSLLIRTAYEKWLNSFEQAYDELDEKFKHPETATTESDRSEQERQEKTQRARALAECLPKPGK